MAVDLRDEKATVEVVLRILRRSPGLKTELTVTPPPDLHLLEAGVLDSFGFLEFMIDLQDELGIALTGVADPTAMMTIGGIVAVLRRAAPDA